MTIVGFNLKKVLVERKQLVRGEVKVATRMNITDVTKEEFKLTPEHDVLNFTFQFLISYKGVEDHIGDVASIEFIGSVLSLIDPKETKKILEGWKKKELSEELKARILNTILTKCNIKALMLEEELGLPPHLPLPRYRPKIKG